MASEEPYQTTLLGAKVATVTIELLYQYARGYFDEETSEAFCNRLQEAIQAAVTEFLGIDEGEL